MPRTVSLLALLLTACSSGSTPAAVPSTTAPPATVGPLAPATGPPSAVIAKVRLGGQPCGVLAEGRSVWVTNAETGMLHRIDRATQRLVASTRVGTTPCELTAGFGSLWVSTQSGELDRVDPATGKVLRAIAVGVMSYEPLVAFGSVWVSNRGSDTISKVDPRTNRVVATVPTPGLHPGGLVEAGGAIWVGNDTGGATNLARLDPQTLALTPATAGDRPAYVAAAAGSVWVSNVLGGTVTQLDPTTGAVRSTVPLVALSPVNLAGLQGREVWVPDDQGNLLVRIDARSARVLERLPVGRGPAVVAPDGGDVWVTNFLDGSVWKVHPA